MMKGIKRAFICIKNKKNQSERLEYQTLQRAKYSLFFSDDNVNGNRCQGKEFAKSFVGGPSD